MSKITLDTVTGGYDLSVINNNFDKLETELNTKVLYRNNPDGEPNTFETDVDVNAKRLFNLPEPLLDSQAARLQDVQNALAGGAANLIQFTPYGHVSGNNIQTAVQELIDDTTNNGVALPAFLKDSNAIVVDNIAALKAIDKTKFTKALVLGYYTKGDGGGGVYWYDSADTTTADNGGTVIVATDGGRWKLSDAKVVSVKDFGAVGDGVADDTAAIQAALDAASAVYFPVPSSFYKITAALQITAAGKSVRGAQKGAVIIKQVTGGQPVFNVQAAAHYTTISDLTLDYDVAAATTAGSTAVIAAGQYSHFSSIMVTRCDIGFKFTIGPFQNADDIQVLNYKTNGILCTAINDVMLSRFLLNAGSSTNGATGGLRLQDRCEAIVCAGGEILDGVYAFACDATLNTFGNRPAYCNFTDVFFDSAAQPVTLNHMAMSDFVSCWFSNGRSGTGASGCYVATTDSVSFTNCRFVGCGDHGCYVTATASRTSFEVCRFDSNSITTGAGVSNGLMFAAGASDFLVHGCIARNGLHSGTQGVGIYVAAGASNRYVISDNLVTGNGAAGISDGGTGTSKRVAGNIGYNPLPAAVQTLTVSPFTYTNNTGATVSVNISNGTVSQVTLAGNQVAAATNCTVAVPHGLSLVITYSVAPIVQVFGH